VLLKQVPTEGVLQLSNVSCNFESSKFLFDTETFNVLYVARSLKVKLLILCDTNDDMHNVMISLIMITISNALQTM
jgi:hypothetical protein